MLHHTEDIKNNTKNISITNAVTAKYAMRLLRRGGSGIERLSSILLDASVDLNPHQVFAAVEVLDNPYSRGRILSDEVGLGKTIEASIVIAQMWAEGHDGER
ncbi:MAG: hypothetical protein LBU60_05945 [Clostridiales bacterium]|jgi:SNF2 family DNA or RNA helicase|nr:hypothetical protein [Clostridiales bacterium]